MRVTQQRETCLLSETAFGAGVVTGYRTTFRGNLLQRSSVQKRYCSPLSLAIKEIANSKGKANCGFSLPRSDVACPTVRAAYTDGAASCFMRTDRLGGAKRPAAGIVTNLSTLKMEAAVLLKHWYRSTRLQGVTLQNAVPHSGNVKRRAALRYVSSAESSSMRTEDVSQLIGRKLLHGGRQAKPREAYVDHFMWCSRRLGMRGTGCLDEVSLGHR
jgi:hypothetical protein